MSTTLLHLSSSSQSGEEGSCCPNPEKRLSRGLRAVARCCAPARLSGWSQSSRPALTCIISARRAWIVPMISSTSVPCRYTLVVETYESPSWRWITGSGTPCGSESSRGAGRDLTRSAPALPGSAARRATAPQSARAAADRACPLVSSASPRRSHRPSADQPDTRGPCSVARARRCDRASPRVNAAYRRRREQQLRRHRSLPSRADC